MVKLFSILCVCAVAAPMFACNECGDPDCREDGKSNFVQSVSFLDAQIDSADTKPAE